MPPPLTGFAFHAEVLGGGRHVVAPMVDASELAWRQLARRYDAHVCYTPMWHSGVFVRDEKYRANALQTCPEDRPLIVQFAANDPETFKRAVELTLQAIDCDAIDLNIGCPQVIARRGHFGSFLQEEWELLRKLVSTIHNNFSIPITCKLRVFTDVQRTVNYAKMLESAGAQLLTVHGRTREQKGALTGLASWEHIKAVVEAVKVPVFANGNIQSLDDVNRCIKETGVAGVMSAETHLTNPAFFAGIDPPVWQMCIEYLDLVDRYPCPLSYSRGHIFKMLNHVLQIKANADVRQIVAKSSTLDGFREAVLMIKERYLPYHTKEKPWVCPEELEVFKLRHPPWICQPYVRPTPEEHLTKLEAIRAKEKQERESQKRPLYDEDGNEISKRKFKKLERNPNKKFPHGRAECKLCSICPNPAGTKCGFGLCRKCCQKKCYEGELDCSGHKILVKSKREAARRWKALEASTAEQTEQAAESMSA